MTQSFQESFRGGIKTYLREIRQIPLLGAHDEVALAARIRQGDHQARQKMIHSNLRLVASIAFKHIDRGVPLPDLISEGNLGLVTAVERYDPARRSRFSTYATWWIQQSIHKALADDATIRIPGHVADRLKKIRRASSHMTSELGRAPTDEELAEEIGLSHARVGQIRMTAIASASLNAPVDEEGGELADLVGDSDGLTPFDETQSRNQVDVVRSALEVLTERERKIITDRFGLDGTTRKTLAEIGVEIGRTRERTRQVERIALRKLRKAIKAREAFPQAFVSADC